MCNNFKKIILALTIYAIAIYIASFTSLPAETKIAQSTDTDHLQQASNLIKSKHYRQGYVSFKSMAKKGCPYSQCILGIMHQNGLGVRKSAIEAKYWFQKSAQQGFADAEHRLGLMYYHGNGIKKDLTLARLWLTKAANQGVEEARQLLAQIPGESNISNTIAQTPQQIVETTNNIQRSWQGYSEVVKQLNQLTTVQ